MPAPVDFERLRAWVALCDPLRPLSSHDPLYVPFDDGEPTRGGHGESCIATLHRLLLLKDCTCQLFSGFPGTGKTTELRRLEVRLAASTDRPTFASYVDVEEYLDRYSPIGIHDIIRILAYHLDREAAVAEGHDPDRESSYLRRLFDFLSQTDVELQKIGFGAYGNSLMLELKNNPTFRTRAESQLKVRFQQFARDAEAVMVQAVSRISRALKVERVVLLVDGLEKMTPLRDEDRGAFESSVEQVFVQHAEFLRLPCHAIYTFPPWLRFRVAELGALYDSAPVILPMVRTTDRDGKRYEPGVSKLIELVARRIGALETVFGPSLEHTLLPLIFGSGGYPRDLLRLVRQLLVEAPAFPVDAGQCQRVLEQLAQQYAFVVRGTHLPILKMVHETHALPQANSEDVATFGRLLERWLILAYRDEVEWYDLHPLVRRARLVQGAINRLEGG